MMQLPLVQQTISYDDMPTEMRMEIINEMDPESRNAISQLSKGSYLDAQRSPYYIDNVTLLSFPSRQEVKICIGHRQGRQDYTLSFEKSSVDIVNIVRTRSSDSVVISSRPVQTTLDVYEFAINYFKDTIISFGRNIRSLSIRGAHFDWNWAEIPSFQRLEELCSVDEATVTTLLQKIRMPLRRFELENRERLSDQLADLIYSDLHNLTLRTTILDDDQLYRIRARNIVLSIGLITPYGVIRFIRDWLFGGRNDHLSLSLNWRDGRFNQMTVLLAFADDYLHVRDPPLCLRQHAPNRKMATIKINRQEDNLELRFDIYQ